MTFLDIFILVFLAIWIAVSVLFMLRRRRSGGCFDCKQCGGVACSRRGRVPRIIAIRQEALFEAEISRVWEAVTDVQEFAWRSDLAEISAGETDKRFTEYTKQGFPTYFTVLLQKMFSKYCLTFENENLSGYWQGEFWEETKGTSVRFSEYVIVKKPFLYLAARGYLKRQQKRYLRDLQKKLER